MTEEYVVKISAKETRFGGGQIKYKGKISFDDHNFHYNLTFFYPMDELEGYVKSDPKRAMNTILLNVEDGGGMNIPLNDEAKTLFMGMVGRFAIDTYHRPESRYSKEGFLEMFKTEERTNVNRKINREGMETTYKLPREIPQLESFLESLV